MSRYPADFLEAFASVMCAMYSFVVCLTNGLTYDDRKILRSVAFGLQSLLPLRVWTWRDPPVVWFWFEQLTLNHSSETYVVVMNSPYLPALLCVSGKAQCFSESVLPRLYSWRIQSLGLPANVKVQRWLLQTLEEFPKIVFWNLDLRATRCILLSDAAHCKHCLTLSWRSESTCNRSYIKRSGAWYI